MRSRKPKGERRHGAGWEAYIRVNGDLRRKTFALDSTPAQRHAWRVQQRDQGKDRITHGSFAADVTAYLATVRHMPTHAERAFHLQQWLKVLGGERSRATITTTEINQALSTWRLTKSPMTVRHYRTALLHLFSRLDGKDAANPVRGSWRPKDPPMQPRSIPPDVLRAIIKAIKGPKTKTRLWVMASTGLPQRQLMQLTPESVDWERLRVMIPAREKGSGAPARWLPLNRHARYAFRAMTKHDAWGTFSTGGMRMTWQRALTRLNLPKHLRPYDVRHSVATQIYAATGDLATVARLLGHSDVRTASRYSIEAHAATDRLAMSQVRWMHVSPHRAKKTSTD
ncbi:MAG TPA: tyrosine-type recombinase/integrase [Thermoanaerobaculia bacterium]|nr:tyrosine-type recombinase/integrase [Thermoanaerobaculia bacterium]